MNEAKPKVSVCVVAYNHEKYIRGCLQSLVDQQANFSFEIIVADDCSKDGTRVIVEEFASKYPEIVRPFFHPKNIGAGENYLFAHAQARGEYIAHVDGDDYALPGKLQAQADYLDRHSDCSIVWHRMRLLNEANGGMADDLLDSNIVTGHYSRADILRLVTIGLNSSKMYRADVRDFSLPSFPVMDFLINVEQVGRGYAAFAGVEPLGVYRVGVGVASAGNATKVVMRDSFLYFLRKYPEYSREISMAALVLFLAALKNGRWSVCRLYGAVLLKCLRPSAVVELAASWKIISRLKIPASVKTTR